MARDVDGLLTRFAPPGDPLTTADGFSLVEDGNDVVAWALWCRHGGYDHDGVLSLDHFAASTPEGADGLVRLLRGWASVAPTLRLRTLPADALAARLPLERARVHTHQTWMMRPVDLSAWVRDRGWPRHLDAHVVLRVVDEVAPWNAGTWALEVSGGQGSLQRSDQEPAAVVGSRALAVLMCGRARSGALARAGVLDVAPGHDSAELDVLQPSAEVRLLDYF